MTRPPDAPAPPIGARRLGGAVGVLNDEQVRAFVADQLAVLDVDGRSVCVVVPDGTRSCPLPLVLDAISGALHGRASQLTVLVALGTHAAMSDAELARHLGHERDGVAVRSPDLRVRNHEWWDPARLVSVGTISAERIAELSEGRLQRSVEVRLNRAVVDHDVTLLVGPVFPHEVVGFSGGNKYLVPGVAAREIIDLSHWLGALITSAEIIGTLGTTPVRSLIDEAAALVPSEVHALCLVVAADGHRLGAASFGPPRDAWASAAEVSAQVHVRYLDAPVQRVLSLVPARYADLWTGAKGFYKVEPVVADGGEVILHAPHIREFSAMHPEIAAIGYHNRDYFLQQWDRFSHLPWGDLAHSTHLRGAGSYDPVTGEERNRVRVTLASSIPEDVVRAANLAYLDPSAVDIGAMEADPGTLVVHRAGEVLYRLRSGP